jgi:hypothetical protein
MERIKKNFGFGCMRLPMIDDQVDTAEMNRMVDAFLAQGFNYFDTAHVYLGGKSELALRECLAQRYPREDYILTNKLSSSCFHSEEEIRPFLQGQLDACGVEYFDFYLMHAQNRDNFKKYQVCRAYETAFALRDEGKVRHVGLSFHDSAEVLDHILTTYPQVEVVQLQINYLDWDDPGVQSHQCLEVCRKHGKPVIVMEPVKGGRLANLTEDAKAIFDELHGGSPASYAIRYAAGCEGVFMVLSGMSDLVQMEDNLSYMKEFQPLNEEEQTAIAQVKEILLAQNLIPCTSCRYCTDGCPKQIPIPDLFSCMNDRKAKQDWSTDERYAKLTAQNGKASDCVKCGKCENACPQHLAIRELLEMVADAFE